jgi:hypothetical protein
MRKKTAKRRGQIDRRPIRAGKEVSVECVVAQFHNALVCIDQFGFSGGLILGCFMVTSFLVQAARSVVEKGVL